MGYEARASWRVTGSKENAVGERVDGVRASWSESSGSCPLRGVEALVYGGRQAATQAPQGEKERARHAGQGGEAGEGVAITGDGGGQVHT